ncbi:MAG: hypothetical protein C0473_01890 [Cyanobacteria bacterium DS3.002]|nr:hypothetical protein [Cyanobacteria bacterium DS3.002]MBA4049674.1 hypothetical protein [Cyanobacteria bacterium DS2.008]MBA4078667.1 hypothetical protein [Cyanobacteria bacterium PR.023]
MRINKQIRPQKSRKLVFIEDVIKPGRIRTASFAQAYPEVAALWDFKKTADSVQKTSTTALVSKFGGSA